MLGSLMPGCRALSRPHQDIELELPELQTWQAAHAASGNIDSLAHGAGGGHGSNRGGLRDKDWQQQRRRCRETGAEMRKGAQSEASNTNAVQKRSDVRDAAVDGRLVRRS
jgi:hypothetical protein